MADMTRERVDELRTLAEKATPGPWKARKFIDPQWSVTGTESKHQYIFISSQENDEANTAFVSASREAIPDLLATVEELVGALGSIQWKSCEKDNMEYSAKITCFQLDDFRSLLSRLEKSDG